MKVTNVTKVTAYAQLTPGLAVTLHPNKALGFKTRAEWLSADGTRQDTTPCCTVFRLCQVAGIWRQHCSCPGGLDLDVAQKNMEGTYGMATVSQDNLVDMD